MTQEELLDTIFVGYVEDTDDPKRLGRIKVRVVNVFDEMPVEDIPWAKAWKDLNGNAFNVPDKGKVVSVVFNNGSIYKPEYIYAEHYNRNLEKKLEEMNQTDYVSIRSLLFDHSTQIYRTESEGVVFDNELSNFNINDEANMTFNLRENRLKLFLGTKNASQQFICGNNFMTWMVQFMNVMSGSPFLGNAAIPVLSSDSTQEVSKSFMDKKQSLFLSDHVEITDNQKVEKINRSYIDQIGDKYKSTVAENENTIEFAELENVEEDNYISLSDALSGEYEEDEDEEGEDLEEQLDENSAVFGEGSDSSGLRNRSPIPAGNTGFEKVTLKVIQNMEGGYFHEDMLTDGRASGGTVQLEKDLKGKKPKGGSGETMFGLDRKAGAQESVPGPGRDFWALMDKNKAKDYWSHGYIPGNTSLNYNSWPGNSFVTSQKLSSKQYWTNWQTQSPTGYPNAQLKSDLENLCAKHMYNHWLTSKKQFTPQALKMVEKSELLTLHYSYGLWNGPGFFSDFVQYLNTIIANGETDLVNLERKCLNMRAWLISNEVSMYVIWKGGRQIAKLYGLSSEYPTLFPQNKKVKIQAIFNKWRAGRGGSGKKAGLPSLNWDSVIWRPDFALKPSYFPQDITGGLIASV